MSALAQPIERRIYIDVNNWDPRDVGDYLTVLLGDLPHVLVPDTPENRLKAALACCVQLTRRLSVVEEKLNNLKKTQIERAPTLEL